MTTLFCKTGSFLIAVSLIFAAATSNLAFASTPSKFIGEESINNTNADSTVTGSVMNLTIDSAGNYSGTYSGTIIPDGGGSGDELNIFGGYAAANTNDLGEAGSALSNNNSVTLNNSYDSYIYVYGGYASVGVQGGSGMAEGSFNVGKTEANNNTVNIYNLTDSYLQVMGGYAECYIATDTNTSSEYNTVNASSGTYNAIAGGFAAARNIAVANHNTVTLNNAEAMIIGGGVAISDDATTVTSAFANNNEVTIIDSFAHFVVGGLVAAESGGSGSGSGEDETILKINGTNNIVNIEGASDIGMLYGASLFGSAVETGNALVYSNITIDGDVFTGNTLNMKTKGITVYGVGNFQNYNFFLPQDTQNGDTVMTILQGDGADYLYVMGSGGSGSGSGSGTGTVAPYANLPLDLSGTTVKVGVQGSDQTLHEGDSVILMDSPNMGITGTPDNSSTTGMQGVTLQYTFALSTTTTQLIATVTSFGGNSPAINTTAQSKALSEGRAAGMSFVNQGGSLVSDISLINETGADSFSAFGAIDGGYSKYETGSDVKINGVSAVGGLSRSFKSFEIGAFAEYGYAKYDSYNYFSTVGDVDGSGEIRYAGGGLFGQYNFLSNYYLKAGVRIGSVYNDFHSPDMIDPVTQITAKYDYETMYLGSHIGVGRIFKISGKLDLDTEAKYLWTKQDAVDADISTGEKVRFDDVFSNRALLRAKVSYKIKDMLKPYVAAAYEYEFDGDINAKSAGLEIDAPSLKGGNVSGEIGLDGNIGKLMIGLGIKGYTGVREGASGMLKLKYAI